MKLQKLSPKKWCLSLIALLVMTFSSLKADAHAVQVGYYVLPNGFLRVYIEHWHGDMTTASLVNNGMSITTTYGSTSVTQNVNPTGAVNNTAWNALPFAGSNITILGKVANEANRYNDWAYYDFAPAACGVPLVITLNGGITVVLQEADGTLWPKTITGTFVDNSGPTITPVNNTATVACGATGTNVNFSSTVVDNCSNGLTATYSIAPGSFFPVGTTNVTATSTDEKGNTTTTTFPVTVNVIDNIPPVISSCPSNIFVGTDLNSCGATVEYQSPKYSDNCGVANISLVSGIASGGVFPIGTTTNIFKVVDGSGNTAFCSFTVTVSDLQPPTPIAKNVVVKLGSSETASVSVFDVDSGSYDNCGPVAVEISGQITYSCADIGKTIPVTLSVQDGHGLVATTIAYVTVTDPYSYCNAAPVAVCKPLTLSANSGCKASATANDFNGGSSDPDGDAMTFTVFPAGPYAVGTTNVTLTVTDPSGASSSCNTTITVVDVTAPTVTCLGSIIANNELNKCSAVVVIPAPAISDNCLTVCNTEGLDEYSTGLVSGKTVQWAVWPGGASASVTSEKYLSAPNSLKVTGQPAGGPVDQIFRLGNQTAGEWILTFHMYIPTGKTGYYNLQHTENLDSWAHQVKFNSDGVAVLNANGPNTIFNYPQEQWFEVKQVINQTTDQTSLFVNGVHVRTWQFSTHANGPQLTNQIGAFNFFPVSISSFMGAVEPNPSATPLFYVDDITVCGSAPKIGQYVSRRYSRSYPVGTTPVAITISDLAGNKTTCNSLTVTVKDTQKPTITGLSPVSVNADNGACTASNVALGTPVTTDNCGVASVQNNAPAVFPVGATNVTWTVTDIHGNVSIVDQKVTVTDNQAPVFTCTVDKFFCYSGTQYIAEILNVSDNCGVASIAYTVTGATERSGSGSSASGTFNVGVSTITWTVTDIHGNVTTCSSTLTVNPPLSVTVADATAYANGVQPNTVYLGYASAQAITISGTPAGGTPPYTYSWSTGANSSSITVAPTTIGTHYYTVTVSDAKGCAATFSKAITVVDVRCGNKNDKVLVCQKTTSASNPFVQICVSASAVATHLANGSTLGACTNNAVTRTNRTSVQAATAKLAMAYPNPSKGVFNLQMTGFAAGKVTIQVVNALGKTVLTKEVNVAYTVQDESLNLQGVASGMYQIRIIGKDGVATTGVVITR